MYSPWGYLINQTEEERILELRSRNVIITCHREHLFEISDQKVLKTLSFTCFINGTPVDGTRIVQNEELVYVRRQNEYQQYLFLEGNPRNKDLIKKLMLILNKKYTLGTKIGQGGFGSVFALTEKASGYKMALKVPTYLNGQDIAYIREAQVLRELNHPCIIKTEYFTYSPPLMIMEYMGGGDLTKFVNEGGPHLTEKESKIIFYQIVQAVRYLHSQQICHRDLKPANILLHNGNKQTLIKVTDLGLAKSELIHSPMYSFCGTEIYMAPEVRIHWNNYDKKIDVWSMGVILHLSLSGKFPEFKRNSSSLQWPENILGLRNNSLLCLLQGMLQKTPMMRFDIFTVDQQEWFKDQYMLEVVSKLMKSDTSVNFKQRTTPKQISDQIPKAAEMLQSEINPAAIAAGAIGVAALAGGLMFVSNLLKPNRNN